MINLDFSTLIDKPIKDVFGFVANPNNMSKWNSAIVSLEQVTPGNVGVGTTFKSVGEMMGRRIEGEMQVITYEPDSRCGFQMQAGPMQVNMNLSFKPVGTGTKVSLNAQGNPAGFFQIGRRFDDEPCQIDDGRKPCAPEIYFGNGTVLNAN